MGIAGNQPSGHALPSLIRGVFASGAEHFRAASAVFPASELLAAALSDSDRSLASRCVSDPGAVLWGRERAADVLRSTSESMAHQRLVWSKLLPEGSPARALNLPLVALFGEWFEFFGHLVGEGPCLRYGYRG